MDDILRFFGVMMTLLTTGLVGYAGLSVINVIRHRADRNAVPAGLDPDEVDLIRAQLTEMDQLRQRVAELEERVDFSERLLGQVSESRGVGPGQG